MIDGDVLDDKGWSSTSISLLERVRQGPADAVAWRRFVALYEPLVASWCRAAGLQAADVDDVCQEVFRGVCGRIAAFERGRAGGTLRGWLRTITTHAVFDLGHRKARQQSGAGGSDALAALLAVPDPATSADDGPTVEEKRLLLRQAVTGILQDVQPQTREIFCRVVVDRQAPAVVAADLNVAVHVVYLVKSRVLKRLRDEYGDLIDLDDT